MTFSPELNAPVPVLATWQPFPTAVLVAFSVPIHATALDVGNWFVRYGGQAWTVTGVAGGALGVTVVLTGSVPDVGPDVVSYSPPPYDVLSAGGLVPAPAFADYAIT